MNTDVPYQRFAHSNAEPQDPTVPRVESSPIALYGDPSNRRNPEQPQPPGHERSIIWVRPSELATTVTAPTLQRGINVQSELVRRGRRAPAVARRAEWRITRSAIARPETPSPSTEGIGL